MIHPLQANPLRSGLSVAYVRDCMYDIICRSRSRAVTPDFGAIRDRRCLTFNVRGDARPVIPRSCHDESSATTSSMDGPRSAAYGSMARAGTKVMTLHLQAYHLQGILAHYEYGPSVTPGGYITQHSGGQCPHWADRQPHYLGIYRSRTNLWLRHPRFSCAHVIRMPYGAIGFRGNYQYSRLTNLTLLTRGIVIKDARASENFDIWNTSKQKKSTQTTPARCDS